MPDDLEAGLVCRTSCSGTLAGSRPAAIPWRIPVCRSARSAHVRGVCLLKLSFSQATALPIHAMDPHSAAPRTRVLPHCRCHHTTPGRTSHSAITRCSQALPLCECASHAAGGRLKISHLTGRAAPRNSILTRGPGSAITNVFANSDFEKLPGGTRFTELALPDPCLAVVSAPVGCTFPTTSRAMDVSTVQYRYSTIQRGND